MTVITSQSVAPVALGNGERSEKSVASEKVITVKISKHKQLLANIKVKIDETCSLFKD